MSAPQRIGNYRVLGQIGTGATGVVYLAVQESIARQVAIKVLHASLAGDSKQARRFLTEARAVNIVRHPGLVQISEVGQTESGRPYLVMELLQGQTLRAELTRRGKLPLPEALRVVHRPATPDEQRFFASYGRVSHNISMQSMTYALRDGKQAERELVEVKAVNDAWPLLGSPSFTPAQPLSDILHCEDDGICGAAAEQTLLDRLHARRGDLLRLGNATLRIIAVLNSEPDRISTGFSLGPHILISTKALAGTGLQQPGSLINYTYRIAFAPNAQKRDATIESFKADAARDFPDAGWQIRDRNDAASLISTGDIADWSRQLDKARHQLFIFDSCYAGLMGQFQTRAAGDELPPMKRLPFTQSVGQAGAPVGATMASRLCSRSVASMPSAPPRRRLFSNAAR